MVSVKSLYAAFVASSALFHQAAAHRRSTNDAVPSINARLVDPSGRPLQSREIEALSGRTVELTVKDEIPSVTKRDELDERSDLILVVFYIAAASGEDDVDAYGENLDEGAA